MKCYAISPFLTSSRVRGSKTSINLPNYINVSLYEHQTFIRSPFFRYYSDLRPITSINDGRARLSGLWVPSSGGGKPIAGEDSHAKLIRAGLLRQAHSGIFHMLPLGLRVQDKLEALIDKYMSTLSASKLSLSSITSEELWARSGRLSGAGSELFRFKDRKEAKYLLAPTHEEEITTLVSSTKPSYKDFPVRLYQISRKYRDERRPRQGLLRSREFIMKDLYTFDYSESLALETYHSVRETYKQLFNELKIPYLVADADSGSIGGDLSHEFHFPTSIGEDHIISCNTCDYVANEELAEAATPELKQPSSTSYDLLRSRGPEATSSDSDPPGSINEQTSSVLQVWRGISHDRNTLFNVFYTADSDSLEGVYAPEVNLHAIKAAVPDLDASIEDCLPLWRQRYSQVKKEKSKALRLINIFDFRVPEDLRLTQSLNYKDFATLYTPEDMRDHGEMIHFGRLSDDIREKPLNLIRIRDGDSCSRCSTGKLKVQKAIELGHTFHLGTRYSEPLKATVAVPSNLLKDDASSSTSEQKPMQMGCHGIGVSRIIGAVADVLADEKGLNWPRVMAPYEAVVISVDGLEQGAVEVYDQLASSPRESQLQPLDLVLDDRAKPFAWKLRDADLVGYPIIVVLGRRWEKEAVCEVQCRRLELREDVALAKLAEFLQYLLSKL